jgi:hypothetical protein
MSVRQIVVWRGQEGQEAPRRDAAVWLSAMRLAVRQCLPLRLKPSQNFPIDRMQQGALFKEKRKRPLSLREGTGTFQAAPDVGVWRRRFRTAGTDDNPGGSRSTCFQPEENCGLQLSHHCQDGRSLFGQSSYRREERVNNAPLHSRSSESRSCFLNARPTKTLALTGRCTVGYGGQPLLPA